MSVQIVEQKQLSTHFIAKINGQFFEFKGHDEGDAAAYTGVHYYPSMSSVVNIVEEGIEPSLRTMLTNPRDDSKWQNIWRKGKRTDKCTLVRILPYYTETTEFGEVCP